MCNEPTLCQLHIFNRVYTVTSCLKKWFYIFICADDSWYAIWQGPADPHLLGVCATDSVSFYYLSCFRASSLMGYVKQGIQCHKRSDTDFKWHCTVCDPGLPSPKLLCAAAIRVLNDRYQTCYVVHSLVVYVFYLGHILYLCCVWVSNVDMWVEGKGRSDCEVQDKFVPGGKLSLLYKQQFWKSNIPNLII